MTEREWLAERFEQQRDHLRAVAYRMLGSLPEAEDAVQDAWLRVSRADASGVENLGGWLTTITARVCLDALRARRARREQPMVEGAPEPVAAGIDPAQEAELADSVGLAMLVVLETLAPLERLALVNGRPGLIVAPRGRLRIAVAFEVANGRVTAIDVIADPDRLRGLDLAVLS